MHTIQNEPIPAIRPAFPTQRRRVRLVVHAAAALLAAVTIGLLAAADAAASDDLGGVVGGTVPAVEGGLPPADQPLAPVTEAVVEPVAERIVTPVADVPQPAPPQIAPPTVPKLPLPELEPMTPVDDPGLIAPVELAPSDTREVARPARADLGEVIALAPQPVRDAHPDADPTLGAGHGERRSTPMLEADGVADVPAPLRAPTDAGSTLAAALVVGLAFAIPSIRAAPALASRPPPIGLTLAPPVPPG